MKNNITWGEMRMLITVVGATATIVASVVMTFSRLDYKLDSVIKSQDDTSLQIVNLMKDDVDNKISLAAHEVRISNVEKFDLTFLTNSK